MSQTIIANILQVDMEFVQGSDPKYITFRVYEFSNGAIMAPLCSDEPGGEWFFIGRDSIQESGLGIVVGIVDTGSKITFTQDQLSKTLTDCANNEFYEQGALEKTYSLLNQFVY